MTHAESNAFWRKQDWTLSNSEIAEITGKSVSRIYYWRKVLKKPVSLTSKKRGPKGPSKWKPDELAKIVGKTAMELRVMLDVTRQRACQLRAMCAMLKAGNDE